MKKILLIVALTLLSVIAFGQKGYEKIGRDTVGVLIKDPINGTFVANGMEKIRNALLGSIGKNFEKMTPLQQKNYLNTEEGKRKLTTLENNIAKAQASEEEIFEVATMWRDDVFGMMQSLRETVDTIEELVDDSYWPIPTYVDLLFGI